MVYIYKAEHRYARTNGPYALPVWSYASETLKNELARVDLVNRKNLEPLSPSLHGAHIQQLGKFGLC